VNVNNEQNAELDRENFNSILAEQVESYRKANNIKISINYSQIKDDKYDIGGKIVTLIQQNSVFKVFDSNKFTSLNEYLAKAYPSEKPATSNGKKAAPAKKIPMAIVLINRTLSQAQLNRIWTVF